MKSDNRWVQEARAERARLQQEHPEELEWLTDLLARHDPMRLIACGAPLDEYDGEAGTILPRLLALEPAELRNAAIVKEILLEEFGRWFRPGALGPVVRYEAIASEIAEERRWPAEG